MRSALARLGRFAFALITLAVLGLGVAQIGSATTAMSAAGSVVAADHCGDQAIGHCDSDEECDSMCQEQGFVGGDCADPPDGCCVCFE